MNSPLQITQADGLVVYSYPCTSASPACDPLVLLHGWGSASNSWQPLLPELQAVAEVIALDLPGFGASTALEDFSLDAVLRLVASRLPERCLLMGWSLGGMLAVQLAARYPQKISHIITLAANVKFVASRDYATAMPLAVNRQFNRGFAQDAAATLKIFSGLLAQGDSNERALLKQVRGLADVEAVNHNWLAALELLATLDNREAFAGLQQPGLHLLADKDVLVPAAAETALKALNPRQQIQVVTAAAHAVHWSKPAEVMRLIRQFLQPEKIAKNAIAQSFSRAASTYDEVADLQRDVGEQLLRKLQPDSGVKRVLDLGCGTGYFTEALQQKFPQADIVGLDLAEGMVRFAQARHLDKFNWLCGDAEQLPLADESVDVIFSSLALQWCENMPRVLAELRRVLKPGGQLLFSTLGPRTFHELKSAWQQVDDNVHVNRFYEPEMLCAQLQAEMQLRDFVRVEHVLEFASLPELTRSIKALGAHNMNQGRARGLSGRKKIAAFKEAYEHFRRCNLLPATYDVYYLRAEKAAAPVTS
jgi:malonyl-CoA O-methyltransferase